MTASKKMKRAKPVPATTGDAMREFLAQGRSEGEIVYCLRCNASDLTSRNGWVGWVADGPVTAPDWSPEPSCGQGLHGWLWGEGDVTASTHYADADAKWLVFAAWSTDVVEIKRKIKAPRAWVVYCGDRTGAALDITSRGACGAVIGSTLTGGARSTLTGGYGSTLTGGYGSTLTGGARSTLTGGARSTLTGGYGSTLTGGYGSRVRGADGAALAIKRWNGKRWKIHTAYVGEEGIEPNVFYQLDADGSFVRSPKQEP